MTAIDRRAFLTNVAAGVAAGAVALDATGTRAAAGAQGARGQDGLADPRFGRCRSARSVHPAGCFGRCASRRTVSAAISTSSGRMSPTAMVRRQGGRMGAGAVLARRCDSAGMAPRRRPLKARIARLRQLHRLASADDGWYALYRRCGQQPLRYVGDSAGEQGARAVPRRHGRCLAFSTPSVRACAQYR